MADSKIQFIIDNLQENLEVEVKNWLNGLESNNDKAKLAKEIIALANSGGGYVFIGFSDETQNLEEITPQEGVLEIFTQDTIAEIIQRYVSPPCQCQVEMVSKNGSDIVHPVIVVPGDHRTPLFAARGSEDESLQQGRVYVRRPGGYSEPARNQDDWEKLIERLVKARQSEMLGAIREILNPSSLLVNKNEDVDLKSWDEESYQAWKNIVDGFSEDDPRRLDQGHWTISFSISSFHVDSLTVLHNFLDRQMPKYSGWPPFTFLHRNPVRPRVQGDLITAYIGATTEEETPTSRADHSDYWRISRDGRGFMLRPMQEDREGYPGQRYPAPVGPFFDWVLPIYRMTEILKYIEHLSNQFGSEDSRFELFVRYVHTNGRKLEQAGWRYHLHEGAVCHIDELENTISSEISNISTNIEEIIYTLLRPIFEQFDFSELPRNLVTNVVRDALDYRH